MLQGVQGFNRRYRRDAGLRLEQGQPVGLSARIAQRIGGQFGQQLGQSETATLERANRHHAGQHNAANRFGKTTFGEVGQDSGAGGFYFLQCARMGYFRIRCVGFEKCAKTFGTIECAGQLYGRGIAVIAVFVQRLADLRVQLFLHLAQRMFV